MKIKNQDYNVKEEFRKDWPFVLLIIGMFIIGIITYNYLPDKIIIHWNIQGEPDNYMSKLPGTFFPPLLAIGVYILMLYTPLIDPRSQNYAMFKKGYRYIRRGVIFFLGVLYIVSLLYNLGYKIDIGKVVSLGLGILFIIIGNYLPQVRHNYFVGIKAPWTLADEEVWRKTHRLGGKLFVAGGIAILISLFLSASIRFGVVIGVAIGVTVIGYIYSYIIYKRKNRD